MNQHPGSGQDALVKPGAKTVTNKQATIGCLGGLALVICLIAGIISATHGAASTSTAGAHTASHAQPTKPPKPTPTPTALQQATALVCGATQNDNATSCKVTWDKKTNILTITFVVGDQGTLDLAHEEVKILAFDAEKAFWTSTITTVPVEVDVIVNGPMQDQYGNTSTGKYGEADLSIVTAAKFNWQNLDQDSAWGDYDYTWLIPQ